MGENPDLFVGYKRLHWALSFLLAKLFPRVNIDRGLFEIPAITECLLH